MWNLNDVHVDIELHEKKEKEKIFKWITKRWREYGFFMVLEGQKRIFLGLHFVDNSFSCSKSFLFWNWTPFDEGTIFV